MSGTDHDWRSHRLDANGHSMAWHECGAGPTLVCLHGSYDHLLYRPMAELLAGTFRCVLYDQRGSGGSRLDAAGDSMHVDLFVDDLESLRIHLGLDRLALLGHSWGAALALLYAQAHPERISHLLLAGPGPLDEEMKACYSANVLRMTDPDLREDSLAIRRAYKEARASGAGVPPDIDAAMIAVWAPVMVYGREQAELFARAYLEAGGHERHIADPTGFSREMQLAHADRIQAPTMVLYGYQDYEPIVQAYTIQAAIPQTRIVFLNRCGHLQWLDQPEAFVETVTAFLT